MKLEPDLMEALAVLDGFLNDMRIRYVIFGALSPVILIDRNEDTGFGARTTKDLDVLVEVRNWEHYHQLIALLETKGFTRPENLVEHRLMWKRQQVDIVPYGKNLIHGELLIWPESGHQMDVSGFDCIFSQAQVVDLHKDGRLNLRLMPPVFSLFTKALAFMDRRYPRDLIDITYILLHYEDIEISERRFEDGIPVDLPYELRGAYLIGQDLKSMLPAENILKLERFFHMIQDESLPALREVLTFHRLDYSGWMELMHILEKVLMQV